MQLVERAIRRLLDLADQLDPMTVRARAGVLALAAGERTLAEDLYVSTSEGDFGSSWHGELQLAVLRDLLGDHDGATRDFGALGEQLEDANHNRPFIWMDQLTYVGRLDEAWARASMLPGYLPPSLVLAAARTGRTDLREAMEDAGWFARWGYRWHAARAMAFVEEGAPELARTDVTEVVSRVSPLGGHSPEWFVAIQVLSAVGDYERAAEIASSYPGPSRFAARCWLLLALAAAVAGQHRWAWEGLERAQGLARQPIRALDARETERLRLPLVALLDGLDAVNLSGVRSPDAERFVGLAVGSTRGLDGLVQLADTLKPRHAARLLMGGVAGALLGHPWRPGGRSDPHER